MEETGEGMKIKGQKMKYENNKGALHRLAFH
jgi:hypothetical protein